MSHSITALLLAGCLVPTTIWAQTDSVTTPPPNFIIANYNSAATGPYGGLEGSAFVARLDDPTAAWFNPAGLAHKASAQISGSAGVYQRTTVAPDALPNEGGAIQQLPNFVGFTFVPRPGLIVGAALLSTNAWEQETDSELITPASGGQQRFAYSADSTFEQRVAAFSAGYHRDGPWRFGGGLAFSLMNVRIAQSASDRIADATGLRSLLVTAHASGTAFQLRTQGGAQYDIGKWKFGGAVRSPGLMIHKSGSAVFEGVLAGPPQSLGASMFDPDARLEYHLPWEFQGGAAFVTPRFELEFDLLAYAPIDEYELLSSDQPVRLYGDAGANIPPQVTSRPFAGLTSASQGVVNVGAGGHFRVLRDRDILIHGGIGSNGSPVASSDTVFTNVDLTSWSLGVSGTLGRFRFAAGVSHQSGNAENVALRNLLNGQVVNSPVDVRMTGFIYSLGYQF